MVVRNEEEAALEKVCPEPLYLAVTEPRRAGIFHECERALKQRIVGQADDDRVGDLSFAVVRERHAHLGQFREPYAEIDVGAWVVGAPALLFAVVAGKHDAAQVEVAIKRRGGGKLRRRTAVKARPDPLSVDRSNGSAKHADRSGEYPG